MLTTYTTYDELRAILGVSSKELSDAALTQPMYDILVDLKLEDVDVNIPAKFAEITALPSPTDVQTRFLKVTKLYAAYAIAKELLTSLPMFSVQRITDGRAEFQRQTDIFADVRDGVDAALTSLRYRLLAAYASAEPTAAGVTRVTLVTALAATLGTDPVTNG